MKKLVFKKFENDSNTLLLFEGAFNKGGCVVSKCSDAEVHVFQDTKWLGKFEGKRKIGINEKTFPMINFDKSEKVFRNISIVVKKVGWNKTAVKTFNEVKINPKEGETNIGKLATLQTSRINMVVITKFLDLPINYELELKTLKSNHKINGYNLTKPQIFVVEGGLENASGNIVSTNFRDNPMISEANVQLLEKCEKNQRLYLCDLESKIDDFFRKNLGYVTETKIIGVKDNIALYM